MNLKTLLGKVALLTKDLVVLAVLVALFAASIYGVKTPLQKSVSLGPYNIAVFDSGLAIYSQGRKTPYWGISPLNDYVLTKEGKKEILLSGSDFSEKKFETNLEIEKIDELKDTVEYFLGKSALVYEMKKPTMEVSYNASIDGNLIKVERNIQSLTPGHIVATGITLSFSANDLIYEPSTNTFIFYKEPKDARDFAKFLDSEIKYQEMHEGEYLAPVVSGKAALVNKYLPGVLVVSAGEGQRLIVDSRYGVILAEEQVDVASGIKTELNLSIFESPEDLAKSL